MTIHKILAIQSSTDKLNSRNWRQVCTKQVWKNMDFILLGKFLKCPFVDQFLPLICQNSTQTFLPLEKSCQNSGESSAFGSIFPKQTVWVCYTAAIPAPLNITISLSLSLYCHVLNTWKAKMRLFNRKVTSIASAWHQAPFSLCQLTVCLSLLPEWQ